MGWHPLQSGKGGRGNKEQVSKWVTFLSHFSAFLEAIIKAALHSTKSLCIHVPADVEVQFKRILKTDWPGASVVITKNCLFSVDSPAKEDRDDILSIVIALIVGEEPN